MRRFLLGVLLGATIVGAVVIATERTGQPELTIEQRQVLKRVGFVDETVSQNLRAEIAHRDTELAAVLAELDRVSRISGRVEWRPVEVVREVPVDRGVSHPDSTPSQCESTPIHCPLVEDFQLAGDCKTEIAGTAARVFWTARARWNLGGATETATAGPMLADTVRFESAEPPEPRIQWPRFEARVGRYVDGWDFGVTYSPWDARPVLGRFAFYAGHQTGSDGSYYDERPAVDARTYGGVAMRF